MWPWKPRPPRTLGQQGEDAAARYLRRKGYRILERNVRAGRYEIDIIARYRDELIFVEVRSRSAEDAIAPEDTIGPVKQEHVRRAVEHYLARLNGPPVYARIDIVAVILPPGGSPKITHYENAF